MAKLLRLPIAPPYRPTDNPAGPWTQVYGYGLAPNVSPPLFRDHVLLRTTDVGSLRAVAAGRLSIRPPDAAGPVGGEPIEDPVGNDAELPEAVTLYLHLSATVRGDASFTAAAAGLGGFVGFAYRNVETASLQSALAELLDSAVLPVGSIPRAEAVARLLRGDLDVPVTVGHAIGAASTSGAPAGSRQVGLAAISTAGQIDPSFVFDVLRDFVKDGQDVVDGFLGLAPRRWPVIDPALTTQQAITRTAEALYSMPVLEELRRSHALIGAQWRTVGNNQKAQYRARLLQRVGHPLPESSAPPFEFNDQDWKNIFQLEAVAELYANFEDPWADGAAPRAHGANGYVELDFLDQEGLGATVNGRVVTLDGAPDLSRVWSDATVVNDSNGNLVTGVGDKLYLDGDTARATRLYRITAVDEAAGTVTLDAAPALSADASAWTLRQRPHLIFVDSFGARLKGTAATVSDTAAEVLRLDGTASLTKVNPHFDTIYLPSDTARASRAYRIEAVDPNARTVTLDGEPALEGGSSSWQLSAGVSGELPALDYTLGPGAGRGHDHYDGIAFVVHVGAVHSRTRFSTYTSRNYAVTPESERQLRSSIKGNRRYRVLSFRSTAASRNYCFKVTEFDAADGVRIARFYFEEPVTNDSVVGNGQPVDGGPGKTAIRIHLGNRTKPAGGTGSAGCLVSPDYYALRRSIIARYQADAPLGPNAQIQKAAVLTHPASASLLAGTSQGGLSEANWQDKIAAYLWLIRPDERPLPP